MVIKSFAAATFMGAALLLAACGGSSDTAPTVTVNPAPIITALSPTTVVAADLRNSGAANITLTVTGTGFIDGSVVWADGTPLTTKLIGPTQLTAVMTAATVLSTQGTRSISVFNPRPGGGPSDALLLTVR